MCMVKLKMSNHMWLRTCTPAVFTNHLNFILGEDVYGLQAKDADGKVVGTPSWNLVLSYEFRIREDACKRMNQDRVDCEKAFTEARKDTELKTKFFTTPMAISVGANEQSSRLPPAKRPFESNESDGLSKNQKRKMAKANHKEQRKNTNHHDSRNGNHNRDGGKGAGGGKAKGGGGKGAGKQIPPGVTLHKVTTDGRQICFRFNNMAQCGSDCNKIHCCQICFDVGHPFPKCPKMSA